MKRAKMMINRYNYQEYFLLYTDNELQPAERLAVESFVQQNPDLEEELVMLQQSVFKPDEQVIFENKELLFQFDKKESIINNDNVTEIAISYSDNELNDTERVQVEKFIRKNPHYQPEFDLIQSLKLSVDESVVFPNKEVLYRHEKQNKPFISLWWQMAAAAIILFFAGLFWLNKSSSGIHLQRVAQGTNTNSSKYPGKVIIKEPATAGIDEVINHPKNLAVPSADPLNSKLALSERKNTEKSKKLIVKNNFSGKTASTVKENLTQFKQDEFQNNIAENFNDEKVPKPVHIDNKLPGKRNVETDNLAMIDASMEKNNKKIKEQPLLKINANSDNFPLAKTVANTEMEDEGALLTDKKSPLREIFRKASRFIDKNTSFRTPKKSGLLIGNVEIAFQ